MSEIGRDADVGHRKLTTSESPNQYLTEIMQREVQLAQRPTRPSRRWRLPTLLPLLTLALGLTVWNVVRFTSQPEVLTPAQEGASARFTVYLAAQAIEAYRDSTGSLPSSLAIIGAGGDGLSYQVHGSAYTLTVMAGGSAVTYRSGQDLSRFAGAYAGLAREREP